MGNRELDEFSELKGLEVCGGLGGFGELWESWELAELGVAETEGRVELGGRTMFAEGATWIIGRRGIR